MRLLLFFFLSLGVSGCVTSSERSATLSAPVSIELSPGDVLPVIDTHTHTHFSGEPEFTSGIIDSKEQYLKEMKEAGIVGAVSHAGRKEGYRPDLKAHHVVQCFGVGAVIDLKAIEAGLRSKNFGCVKIYLGYIHRFAYDRAYHPVYRLAEKYDVPVVFHTGDTYSKKAKVKFSDPLTIDEVAVDFPKVTFVIAHLGNPWIESAAEVAYKNDNVYVEASAMMIGDLKKSSAAGRETYLVQPIRWAFGFIDNPSKFMFGTDWPLTGMKDYLDAYKSAIPRQHWCKVFFENAVKVFRMKDLEGTKCHVAELK